MERSSDKPPLPDKNDSRIVFREHGIDHTFLHEGAALALDAERQFLRLNFVSVYVKDQERSKKFFLEQLGFSLMMDVRFPSGYRWIEIAPPDGSARLALVRPAPGFAEDGLPGRSSLITFMAQDVEAKYREWSARGVKFSMPPCTPEWGGLFCAFEDPDGNPFGVASFNQVALALDARHNAEAERREAERLAAQELQFAKQVQARLLPQRLPSISTLDYAGICVQARAVGGDYYDFFELGKGRLAIVIGDIAGKGIAASLVMANLQAILRSQSALAGDDPEQALAVVNRTLFENTEPSAYATLFYAEVDPKSDHLRYANCGHLPGFLLHEDKIENLRSANTVVGLFEQWECLVSEISMRSGEMLVLFTDGVIEARDNNGEEFGEGRLIEALIQGRHLSARALAEAVVGQVATYSGIHQYDDITVVVAKRVE